jgi:hypothetical protein
MKKLTALFAALALAFSLGAPVFAAGRSGAKKSQKTATMSQKSKSKKHQLHAKKKGATEGLKKGQ